MNITGSKCIFPEENEYYRKKMNIPEENEYYRKKMNILPILSLKNIPASFLPLGWTSRLGVVNLDLCISILRWQKYLTKRETKVSLINGRLL